LTPSFHFMRPGCSYCSSKVRYRLTFHKLRIFLRHI
jgi:hypothetical protein